MLWMECPFCVRKLCYVYVGCKPEFCKYCGRKLTPTKLALKLQERILDLTGVVVKPYILRKYVGHWQRASGAFVWVMNEKDGNRIVGSAQTATKLARAKELWELPNTPGTIEIGANE